MQNELISNENLARVFRVNPNYYETYTSLFFCPIGNRCRNLENIIQQFYHRRLRIVTMVLQVLFATRLNVPDALNQNPEGSKRRGMNCEPSQRNQIPHTGTNHDSYLKNNDIFNLTDEFSSLIVPRDVSGTGN